MSAEPIQTAPVMVRSLTLQYVLVGNALVVTLVVTDADGTAIPAEGMTALQTAVAMIESVTVAVEKKLVNIVQMVSGGVAYTQKTPTAIVKPN